VTFAWIVKPNSQTVVTDFYLDAMVIPTTNKGHTTQQNKGPCLLMKHSEENKNNENNFIYIIMDQHFVFGPESGVDLLW
jgi:hypothetical protein